MKNSDQLHIGTSGWHYEHWQGPFYPQDLPKREWLGWYSQRLSSVEINNSFYQLPSAETLQEWRQTSPEGFQFSVKASRYNTHMKKLKEPGEALNNYLERVDLLGEKIGPILFQLPPNWHINLQRLKDFLKTLPVRGYRFVLEFRDPSWFEPQVYDLLALHDVAFCIYDFSGRLSPRKVTADCVYIRLHGPEQAYEGNYDVQTLAG
jgi:uncharacterized protein YecE (DUF72 family)